MAGIIAITECIPTSYTFHFTMTGSLGQNTVRLFHSCLLQDSMKVKSHALRTFFFFNLNSHRKLCNNFCVVVKVTFNDWSLYASLTLEKG